jgi:hypothetical protein
MDDLNLILKFKLAGDDHLHVKGAARIKVDGRGALMLYNTQSRAVETIDIRALQSFSIQQVRPGHPQLAALAVA